MYVFEYSCYGNHSQKNSPPSDPFKFVRLQKIWAPIGPPRNTSLVSVGPFGWFEFATEAGAVYEITATPAVNAVCEAID